MAALHSCAACFLTRRASSRCRFAIERARFAVPVPLAEGFRFIAAYLDRLDRPRTAFCACELRSPKPFTFEGFAEFNRGYVAVLEEWGFSAKREPGCALERSAVIDPPREPCFHAFSYTSRASTASPTFVVAGSGEWPEGGKVSGRHRRARRYL
jgi:hypothetical protein